jgi:hypothetical protein
MAITKVTSGVRTLGTGEVTTANMATDPTNASNLSSGSVPLAQLGNVDTTGIQTDIAILGFKVAANGSLSKYNLVDQTIDAFEDATGVDASTSTDEIRDASNYYSGTGSIVKEFAATDATYAISTGTVVNKLILIGGGGAGGTNLNTGTNGYGSGAGGGAWAGAVNYTVGAGITSANVTIGAGGARTSTTGTTGGTTSVVFGSDLTMTAAGGAGGAEEGAAGAGGTASKSGTSSASTTTLLISGGAGGAGSAAGGSSASSGTTGTLDSVSYTASGGGGGGGGGAAGGTGGNGLSSSYSGGGGGGGGDSVAGTPGGGSGYGTAGTGGVIDGTQNAGSVTIDSVTVSGGAGGVGTGVSPDPRPYTNGGGGGMCGGGGGGGGDGLGGGGGSWNAGAGGQGYVRLEYQAYNNMTLISNATTAEAVPTKGDLVMTYTNGVGTATVNTDIKGWVSRDNGSNYTQFTLTDDGDTGGHTILTAHDLDISAQPSGTSMRYKITTHNQSASKETRIQAVSLGWS